MEEKRKNRRTLREWTIYFLEGVWLPIHAAFTGFSHLVRGHSVAFFSGPDPWIGHLGWIECSACPDCDGADLCIWGHYWRWLATVAQYLCGWSWTGHPSVCEWQTSDDRPSGYFTCSRCHKPMPGPADLRRVAPTGGER